LFNKIKLYVYFLPRYNANEVNGLFALSEGGRSLKFISRR